MKKTLCWKYDELAFPIELWQTSKYSFTVVYGKQVMKRLPYHNAAEELGQCLMHALTCEGKIDNP